MAQLGFIIDKKNPKFSEESKSDDTVSTDNLIGIMLQQTLIGTLPINLAYLAKSIETSKSILNLKDNWDDEGSEKYETSTWIAAVNFLIEYSKTLFNEYTIETPSPKIYQGPRGSIDILWEVEKYRLLVNINKNGEDAMFYADNYNNQTSEGVFKLKNFNRFLLPIAMQN
jgi:hypothetical protein